MLTAKDGAAVRITDFAPRFRNFDRILRPPQLMRRIEPVAGMPRITIRLRPTQNYGKPMPRRVAGSNHITYGEPALVRLTTDAPLSYIEEETAFRPDTAAHSGAGRRRAFRRRARRHRRANFWTAPMNIGTNGCAAFPSPMSGRKPPSAPPSRSSFPISRRPAASSPRSPPRCRKRPIPGRNWDYRYCWLRDAYFVVRALNRIGATKTMEDFVAFIFSIVGEEEVLEAGLWHRAFDAI